MTLTQRLNRARVRASHFALRSNEHQGAVVFGFHLFDAQNPAPTPDTIEPGPNFGERVSAHCAAMDEAVCARYGVAEKITLITHDDSVGVRLDVFNVDRTDKAVWFPAWGEWH